jgi:hypothetical protein
MARREPPTSRIELLQGTLDLIIPQTLRDIVRSVMWQGIELAAMGAVPGVAGALVVAR